MACEKLAVATGVDPDHLDHHLSSGQTSSASAASATPTSCSSKRSACTAPRTSQRCKPEELRDRLNKVNEEKKLVGRIPALAMVNGWVRRAQYLTQSKN